MPKRMHAQMFKSLVAELGGLDAARAVLEAATGGPVSRGTISQIQNGNAELPLSWAWAVEDATGNRCFTNQRTRQTQGDDRAADGCAYDLSGAASQEGGEAVSAGIRAEQSANRQDWITAAVEAREAEQSFANLARYCEGRAGIGDKSEGKA